jgi:predicted transcriptional regulator
MAKKARRQSRRRREAGEIGDAELQVLKELWDGGPMTVREVLTRLHEKGRELAYTTVLTFLTRLEQKGYVASDKDGAAYVYRPTVSRENVTRIRLKAVMSELFDGAAGPMVLHLLKSERLTEDEVAELRRLIEELDSN